MKTMHDKLRPLAVLMSAVACLALPSIADEPAAAQEPAELKTLRIEYRQRLVKARTPADELYRGQLRSMLDRYKRAGNLDASVAVQAEMQNPDPTQPAPPDKPLPPDLAGIRSTYVLATQRNAQPVDAWYRQQLEALERVLVQRGDIAGARSIRAVIDQGRSAGAGLPAASQSLLDRAHWEVPYGGKLKNRDGGLAFSGGGTLQHQGAVAFLDRPLGSSCSITGEINHTGGPAVGFALGNENTHQVALFNIFPGGKNEINLNLANREVVSHIGTLPIEWRSNRWIAFMITVEGERATISVGTSQVSISLPNNMKADHFGLVAFEASTIELRNLSVQGLAKKNMR